MAAKDHPAFRPAADVNSPVWRYMDFTKYVAMLERAALFFSRSDLLGDPFEGSYSRANEALRPEVYKDAIPPEALNRLSAFSRWARGWTFVNCWHLNPSESAAMWSLYAPKGRAVAVQSAFAALRDALPDSAFLGAVSYIDYDNAWMPEGNAFYPFLHKRLSYEHEREVRAIIQNLPTAGDRLLLEASGEELGRLVPVDLAQLVKAVLIAPSSPDWFLDLVQRVTAKYGCVVPVRRSRLDDAPFF